MQIPDTSIAQVHWDVHGVPYSTVFDDKYFCKDNGYEEARHVGCGGNALQERFSGLDPAAPGTFTIIETGFGTGLDFCCAWELWDQYAPKSWLLRFISIELYPLPLDHLDRALGLWPKLSAYKDELAAQYQPIPGGISDMYFRDHRVHLTIVFDDVVLALQRIKDDGLAGIGADAWFLDGFAPSKNPRMWSSEVLDGVAALSCAGTTFSTFTVAGVVRRGLEARGFVALKSPGHGLKRHILTGFKKGPGYPDPSDGSVRNGEVPS